MSDRTINLIGGSLEKEGESQWNREEFEKMLR